ncbi:antibiotic biosynthesis monooxygenase family protein [Streptomyces sp. SID11385]|uniref:antibiotic biosynthesis monooxygenase family protein n=1 Tax=Streptomyces sp. SID11385 TaxID=2706031 RepID=UPI0013CAD2E8|nr:antibiotic biosynthesis monooxygenase family protein [Streptomyces sp. SID11385]NEA43634.1 antibiotic biosynthesis monooxygenase [Streptomyces sp. SID11385]
MVEMRNLDPETPMFAQFAQETGPVVLTNTFVVPPERGEVFLTLFRRQAEYMKARPGFVSLQMHKGTAGSRLFMNVAVWESSAALAAALRSPEFQRLAADFPSDVVSYPHVFERIDIERVDNERADIERIDT